MVRKRFTIDTSGYDGSQVNVVRMSFEQRFPLTTRKLNTKKMMSAVEAVRDDRKAKGLTRSFIRHHKTTTTEAVIFLRKYEVWYIKTLLNEANGISDIEADHLYTLLQIDPTGVEPPNYDDNLLYTATQTVQVADPSTTTTPGGVPTARRSSARLAAGSPAPAASSAAAATAPAPAPTAAPTVLTNSTQYNPTKLHSKMRLYQKELYILFRVNLGEYMDKTAQNVYNAHLRSDDNSRADDDASLNDTNFFDKDKRYPWADIKSIVLTGLCCKPKKGDKISIFRTTRRGDGLVLPIWVADVGRLDTDAANEGAAYKEVAEPEAMMLAT